MVEPRPRRARTISSLSPEIEEAEPIQTLSCIVCDKDLFNIFGDRNQPNDALTFSTHGHYGTTFFDPVTTRSTLVVNICDECMRKAQAKRQILYYRVTDHDPVVYDDQE